MADILELCKAEWLCSLWLKRSWTFVLKADKLANGRMGGGVSALRSEIERHVQLTKNYPNFLEPYVVAVQYFLRTAESGEGTDRDRTLEDIPVDIVITDKRVFAEASTEVELLVENVGVTKALLHAIGTYNQMELAPELDPIRRWYDPPWRKNKPMPTFVEVPPDEIARYQILVLRASTRCIRLMMFCADGKQQLEDCNGPVLLNQAVLSNPLDDFVKKDVKAIFSAVYGGDNAVKRIVISNVPVVVEMMRENLESAIVQHAGIKRICQLLAGVTPTNVHNSSSAPNEMVMSAAPTCNQDSEQQENERRALFNDLDTYRVVHLVMEAVQRFDVDQFLSLYFQACRFISFVAVEERNAKLIGQNGGIEGAIRLLFKAREMQRQKRSDEREAEAREARRRGKPESEWSTILEGRKEKKAPPPPPVDEATGRVTNLATLSVVDFTPTEIGQQSIWALDLLATLDFNVCQMKLHKLKYIMEEIRLDPEAHDLGATLIVTRRLRLIRWDDIGAPSPMKSKHATE